MIQRRPRSRPAATRPQRDETTDTYGIPGASEPRDFDDRLPRCVEAVAKLRPTSVLDIGCGDGFFLRQLRDKIEGASLLAGIDRDPESVASAIAEGLECSVSRLEDHLPYQDGTWDLVFAGEIIEHIADPDLLLSEIWRVLKPGGHLLLTTPNLLCWYNRLLMLAGITPMFVEHSYYANYGPSYSLAKRITPAVGHLRIFNYVPLQMVTEHNGFDCIWIKAAGRLPVRSLWPVDRLIARLRPQLGAQLIVLATKAVRLPISRQSPGPITEHPRTTV